MPKKLFEKFKNKSNEKKFKEELKREKRKIFVDLKASDRRNYKKRNKISIKLPNLKEKFNKKHLKFLYFWIWFAVFVLFIIFLFSPFFSIKTINISTNEDSKNLIDLNIAYNSVNSFRNKNILFLDKKVIENQIINFQKNIDEVKVNKKLFEGTLEITIKSQNPIFYTMYKWQKYFITWSWVYIPTKNISIKWLKELKVSLSNTDLVFFEYKNVLNDKYLNKILEIQTKLSQNIQELAVLNIFYFEKEREVHFDVNNSLKLIFDLDWDKIEEQIMKIVVFNKEHLDFTKNDSVNYIDLRIFNKIYFCENSSRLNCQNNLKQIYSFYNETDN